MAITLMCPNLRCRKILMVPSTARGTRVRCAYCGTTLLVPIARSRPARQPDAEVVLAAPKDEEKKSKKGKKDK
jgi:LSD1 subclass zinc finger protein